MTHARRLWSQNRLWGRISRPISRVIHLFVPYVPHRWRRKNRCNFTRWFIPEKNPSSVQTVQPPSLESVTWTDMKKHTVHERTLCCGNEQQDGFSNCSLYHRPPNPTLMVNKSLRTLCPTLATFIHISSVGNKCDSLDSALRLTYFWSRKDWFFGKKADFLALPIIFWMISKQTIK